MKKNYLIALLALVVNLASAQIEPTSYRGAFAPAPAAMWTDSWTNWDPQNEPYTDAATVVNVTSNITTNTTWTTGKTYKISGLIYVKNNATLTIQPGVVVKGLYTNTGTALVITKGAKINAVGTASAPIVFTSGKAAGSRAAGDWGGIILLGKAGFNLNSGVNNIEGITASVDTQYGGGTAPDDNDNSGTMKYCRIEFPGFVFSPNNEINGLTFGSVGRGTSIDYVQVSYSGDDSFEWFGGSVNCKHLVAYKGLDDDFDTDNGYKGIVQFALGVRDPSIADNPAISTSEGFESDNNAGGTVTAGTDNTSAIFTNCTLIGPSLRATISPTASVASGHARALRLRRATELKVYNSIFLDFKNNILFIDGSAALANAVAGTLKFKNNILAGTLDTTFSSGFNLNGSNATTIPAYLTSNTVLSSSSSILTKAYGTSSTEWAAGNLTASPSNLDYRPGTTAATGADFTDSALAPYVPVGDTPVVSNVTYCKGAVASPLTATLTTTGINLLWYTVATGGTASTTAPTPLTTTVGTKNYWVSQVSAGNIESARVQITVTINALPTEVVGAITGQGPWLNANDELAPPVYASASAVGPFVGTTETFTYSVPAFTTGATYVWTVPAGVNIVSGQGTNTITVNYLNVPAGAGNIGTIQIQAENGSGCRTAAKTYAVAKALPAAPATLTMTNKASATPNTAITTFGQFMGTTTPVTLTAAYAVKAGTIAIPPTGFKWELPAGVNLVIPAGTTPVTTNTTYTAEPFLSANTAPTTVGTKYWVVTDNKYTYNVNGTPTNVTVSTAALKIVGSKRTYTFTITAGNIGANAVGTQFTYNGDTYILDTATTTSSTSVVCTVAFPQPAGNYPTAITTNVNGTLTRVSDGATTAFTKIVKAGYQATTTQNYLPYGTKITSNLGAIIVDFSGVTNSSTTKMYIGVKAYNGVGESATSNATNSDVVANNALTTATGFNNVPGLYYDTYTETYTAPNATTLVNGTSTFALDTKYSTTYATANALPKSNYPSTAKLLTILAAAPAAPSTLVLTDPASATPTTAVTNISKYIGTTTPLTLTAAAVATASSYVWELPTGVNAVGLSGSETITTVGGITTINSTTSRILTVNFAGVAPGTLPASLYLGVKAKNGIGLSVTSNAAAVPATSSTAKLLKVTYTVPAAVTTVTGQIVGLCGGNSYSYTITPNALATSYLITGPAGSVVTSASNTTNSTNVLSTADLTFDVLLPSNFASLATKTITITSVNGYGSSATSKVLTLSSTLTNITAVTGGTTFGRCANQTFSVAAVIGATTYNWTVANGAVIVNGAGTNAIEVDFSAVPTANTTTVITVSATNACGVSTTVKSVTLSQVLCRTSMVDNNTLAVSNVSSVYPNPTASSFNIDVTSSREGNVTMSIFDFYGNLVSTQNVRLNEGTSTINENVSELRNGIYIVKFYNDANNEIIVKKLIKN